MQKLLTLLIANSCLLLFASISLAQNPAEQLIKISSYGPLPYQSNLELMDEYAFVMTPEGLNVIDVSDPASPILSAVYDDVNGQNSKLVRRGTYLYVLEADLIHIYDISTPTAISKLLVLNPQDYSSDEISLRDFAITDSYAIALTDSTLLVFDLTLPASLSFVAEHVISSGSERLWVEEAMLYVVGGAFFAIYDISNILQPANLGQLDTGTGQGNPPEGELNYWPIPSLSAFDLDSGAVAVTSSWDGLKYVYIDFRNPSEPMFYEDDLIPCVWGAFVEEDKIWTTLDTCSDADEYLPLLEIVGISEEGFTGRLTYTGITASDVLVQDTLIYVLAKADPGYDNLSHEYSMLILTEDRTPRGSIVGTLTDYETGEVIRNYSGYYPLITLVGAGRRFPDQLGRFRFFNVIEGEYTLDVRAGGYQYHVQQVNVVRDDTTTVNIQLHKLTTDGNLQVTVKGPGPPYPWRIGGATIRLVYGALEYTQVADHMGYLITPDLLPGSYSLTCSAEGYSVQELYPISVVAGEYRNVEIDLIPLPNPVLGSIDGYVRDSDDGSPIGGATVEIIQGPTFGEVLTSSSGHFLFTDLLPGVYSLKCSDDAYYPQEQDAIAVEAGQDHTVDFDLLRLPSGSIEGYVRNLNDGSPIAGARIDLAGGGTSQVTYSAESGHFEFSNVTPGLYDLQCTAQDYYSDQRGPIEVETGENLHISFDLEPVPSALGVINGHVQNPSGAPIAGALVSLRLNGALISEEITAMDGGFEFNELVVPEVYQVSASYTGYLTKVYNSVPLLTTATLLFTLNTAITMSWDIPSPSAEMGTPYQIRLSVTNQSPDFQSYSFQLDESSVTLNGHESTWNPWTEGTSQPATICPNGTNHHTYHVTHEWDWISSHSIGDIFGDVSLSLLSEIVGVVSDVSVGGILTYASVLGVALNAQTDATFVYQGYVSENQQAIGEVNVTVPQSKQDYLLASSMVTMLSPICTIVGTANIFWPAGWALIIAEGVLIPTGWILHDIAADPPDHDYMVLVQPGSVETPELDTLQACIGQKFAYGCFDLYSLSKALLASTEKYRGAEAADDSQWQTIHLEASRSYASQMAEVVEGLAGDWQNMTAVVGDITLDDITEAKQELMSSGLPEVEISILTRLGVPQSIISELPSMIASFPDEYILDDYAASNLFRITSSSLEYAASTLPSSTQMTIGCTVDILPDTVLLPFDGITQIRCYIELTDGDVMEIRPSSIKLSDDIAPVFIANVPGDFDSDGVPDLELHFDASAVLDKLTNLPGMNLLTVSGELENPEEGNLFVGTDVVIATNLYSTLSGSVVTSDGSRLTGVTIDIFDGDDQPFRSLITDASGNYRDDGIPMGDYTVSVVTPLGYQAEQETAEIEVFGVDLRLDFMMSRLSIDPCARSRAYWAHQLHKALKNKPKDYILDDFSILAGSINAHFNQNQINPVDFYSVPQPASQADSLRILKRLLHMRNTGEWEPFLRRLAKSQLMALMLNVVSGKVSQTHEISTDGRTVSQAITYCDMLVSDEIDPPDNNGCPGHGSPWFRYIYASFMLVKANLGLTVPAGMIPEDVIQIAYKQHNEEVRPTEFALHQNYPNPFNPITEISFSIPAASHVKLEIFNVMGQKVATVADRHLEAGNHSVTWDGSQVASGVYFYRLDAGNYSATRKMILLK